MVPKSVRRIKLRQVCDGRIRFEADQIDNPAAVYRAVRKFFLGADREILAVLCVDSHGVPTAFHVAAVGGLNATRIVPADVLKAALVTNAHGIVLLHNHPSGSLVPSTGDLQFTRAMSRACALLGLQLFDHLILSDQGFVSLRERRQI